MLTITPARLRGRTRRALLAAALPAAFAAVALPSAAEAASVGNGTLSNGERRVFVLDRGFFSGNPTEANNASVAVEGDFLVIRDTAGITTEHQGSQGTCVRVSTIQARCPRSVDDVQVNLAAGEDRFEYRAHHEGFVSLGEGNDTVFGGRREASGRLLGQVTYSGGPGFDTVSYVRADRGVRVKLENTFVPTFDDGRPGDLEGIGADVEIIEGSNFDDTLFGSDRGETFRALNGNDVIEAGAGDDLFDEGFAANGADSLFGDAGAHDRVFYANRTSGVEVTLGDGRRNDGATGEQDNVGGSVEDISGTNFRDVLTGGSPANTIDGRGGADTITGGLGNDTLSVGAGNNSVFGGTGNDVIEARNGQADNIDCGENSNDSDTANREAIEDSVTGCERGTVGVLSLSPERVRAAAGKPVRLRLSWRHPQDWRKLRKVELRLTRDGVPVGEVTIRARGERISAEGAVQLVRKHTRMTHKGKTVTARVAVRLDDSLAGQELQAEVEATDMRGRRQLERDAGTVRVAE